MVGVWAGPAQAHKLYPYKETILKNGLRVIILPDHSCPIVAVQVWYHVGSKNEQPNRQGFAHMFEHMMFRGTDRLKPEEHFSLIRGTGGTCNAFTSFDYTAYVNLLPANQLELALWLEAERMMFLRVNQENYTVERKIVMEERRQDLNEPYGTIFERMMPVIFHQHPYRWLPIGKISHLQKATVDELRSFWDRYYVPSNVTLVIVGDVKHRDALKLVKKYFGWMPGGPVPPKVTLREPPQTAPREVTIKEGVGPAPMLRFVYRAVPEKDPDFLPLDALAGILGNGKSSRLYLDLVKQKKCCQDAYASLWGLEQDGLLMLGAELSPGKDLAPVEKALQEEIDRLLKNGVTPAELEKEKNQLRRQQVVDTLTDMSKAQVIGKTTINEGSPESLNKILQRIEALTPADLDRVARKYLVPERRTLVRVVPEKGFTYVPPEEHPPANPLPVSTHKEKLKRPDYIPEKPPVHPLLATIPQAEIKECTLENGMRIVAIPNHEVPFVSVLLGIKRGAWTDPEKYPGTASMTMAMLTRGTRSHSADALAALLESNALTLTGSASMDNATVNGSGLSDKFDLLMQLLAEVVQQPTFPENELQILKKQRKLFLSIQESDPRYLAEQELRRVEYGSHPYARMPEGTASDVDRLTPEILRAWWQQEIHPETLTLYVAGDITPRAVFREARRFWAKWTTQNPVPKACCPKPPQNKPTHIYLIDVPGAVQSQIRAGQISITRGNPDYHKSRVLTQILGGGFDSRLTKVIRVQKGLTYGIWAYIKPQKVAGDFLIGTFTKTPSTADTVQAIFDVLKELQANPPQKEELQAAKSYLTGSFARGLETPQDIMTYQWIIDNYNLSRDYLEQAMHGYQETTLDDLARLAKSIDLAHLAVVVAGDASKIKEGLEHIAPVTVIPKSALCQDLETH